ncbi:MAG: hypothetical protein J1F04_00520 [Oscillospiraceae bacterium]|nr:hypothetical protein [Oscillospiraceae bacterium]
MTTNKNDNCFTVIDTETNWNDKVMSIGIAIADSITFELIESKYYILTPECDVHGMYSFALNMEDPDLKSSREKVLFDILDTLYHYSVKSLFAYNANFDYRHLPELKGFQWFDIMKIAAYKQYNKAIPEDAECCGTGRLKRNYKVGSIMKLLSGSRSYFEKHNALSDAIDELEIIRLLGYPIERYVVAQINAEKKAVNIHE